MTKLSIHPHKELKTHWYDKLNRFTVKSPESHLARNLSHVARNFRDVAQKKKSSRSKKQILKDQNLRLLIGNNVEKFLSLKRSLFQTTP